jgi:mannose-1-phosphate guanylyltransferase
VRAIVLVGGEGTRLRPLTTKTPKPLLPIVGTPFLERQLAWLAGHGVDDVVLSLGYLPDAFLEHFPDGRFGDLRLHYAVEPDPLGTAGAIRFAASGSDERLVVCNGDVLTTLDLSALVRFHIDHDAEATIHLTRVDDPSAFGVVPTYDDGEVKAFVEKPLPGSAPTDWINAGTYVLEPSVVESVLPDLNVSIERETFPRMLEQRGRLYAHPTNDYWLDIGTPGKYLQAHADVLDGALGPVPAPGACEVQPGVWVSADAADSSGRAPQLASDVVLDGPVFLGANARVGAGARLAHATIGPDAVVEDGAVVQSGVLLERARVGAGTRIIDSIVGPDAVVERGASVTAATIVGPGAHVDADDVLASARVVVSAAAG